MACGLPILAADRPNLRAFVQPEENGLLVAPGSPEAWAQAIQRSAIAPAMRQRWARASRQIAVERYSWPAVASRFEELFVEARARVQSKLAARVTRGAYAGR
jgi:glycosyltransferase involved in cell wall biosynthesis